MKQINIDIFLKEIYKKIVINGKIGIIEWKKSKREFGPPPDHCLEVQKVIAALDKQNYSNIKQIDIGESFYGIIAEKIISL